MKRITVAIAGLFAMACTGLPRAVAEEAADKDAGATTPVKIEKTTESGAKVTVGEVAAPAKTAKAAAGVGDTTPHKARLAVLPAVFSSHFKPSYSLKEKLAVSGQTNLTMILTTEHELRMETPSFTISLTEAFVGSRKFDVLERTRLAEVMKEIDFGASSYGDVNKVVPMGKALNAEYVVLPEVEVIDVVDEAKDVPYVDTVDHRLKGKMIARLRVVDTAGTKIVSAFTEEVQVERRLKANNPFTASESNNLMLDLYRGQAMRMLQRVLETIYPVRLLEVNGTKAVVNRGEGAIAVGDEFEVRTLGKAYVDPDTGESLGQSEVKVAVIKVSKVGPKVSEVEITEGDDKLTGDLKTYLCRETAGSITTKTILEKKPMQW